MKTIDIGPNNAKELGLFCIKNVKNPGFDTKYRWLEKRWKEGLKLRIVENDAGQVAGFIDRYRSRGRRDNRLPFLCRSTVGFLADNLRPERADDLDCIGNCFHHPETIG